MYAAFLVMLVKVGRNQFTLPRGEGVGKSQRIIRTREQQVLVGDLCQRPRRQSRGRVAVQVLVGAKKKFEG